MHSPQATSLGSLKREIGAGRVARRPVKTEIRENLIRKLRANDSLFPGIVGYNDTVVPQIVNAILSRHNFILLGLRGQAKTRILRTLTTLLDPALPVVAGCEIHDDPLAPLCAACRARLRTAGDDLPIAWLAPEQRYVEKLATPDVTIADMIGDLDPIKAARASLELSDEMTMHYGLLPRANRGIFAINELPDLAGKIQVGLFNILQEGDVQIKGYPVRLPLDLLMVFSANPEDYTARGKIITPLKDRIGSEVRTHYPVTRQQALEITQQEAWTDRAHPELHVSVPAFVREVVEEVAFKARQDAKIDKRSGVSQRLSSPRTMNMIEPSCRKTKINVSWPVSRARRIASSKPTWASTQRSVAARWIETCASRCGSTPTADCSRARATTASTRSWAASASRSQSGPSAVHVSSRGSRRSSSDRSSTFIASRIEAAPRSPSPSSTSPMPNAIAAKNAVRSEPSCAASSRARSPQARAPAASAA